MDLIFTIAVHLTIATTVMTFTFDTHRNTIPTNLEAYIRDFQQKHRFANAVSITTRKPYVFHHPTNMLPKKGIKSEMETPRLFVRSIQTGPLYLKYRATTAKPVEKAQEFPPSHRQESVAVPVAKVQLPIPVYPPMPVVLPMRVFFEPVIHDHPPLHKIKKMIKEDERKWKADKEISIELSYDDSSSGENDQDGTDKDTSSMSEYNNVGFDYYDSFIKIGNRGKK